MRMTPFGKLISPEEARRRLLGAVRPVTDREVLPLMGAVGRVAARTVVAPRAVPAFRRATWDGYAVRAVDVKSASKRTPVRLRLVGEIHAEERAERPIRRGECAAVATGAPLPSGSDAVEIFEDVEVDGPEIVFHKPLRAGVHLAEPGEDVRRGQVLVRDGDLLTPARLGALGSTGMTDVDVYVRPLIALVPNGNELVAPGLPLGPGQIHEFNNVTLAALVQAAGGEAFPLPPVGDEEPVLQEVLDGAASEADMVLSTGGSSVGERDLLPRILPRLGHLLFHGISVRPGKPTLAAAVRGKVIIGLPGHPTSCLSNAYWLLWPALEKLAHRPPSTWPSVRARLAEAVEAPHAGFTTVVPLRIEKGWAHPTFHGSSAITSLTGVSGFLLLSPKRPALRRGAEVEVTLPPFPLASGFA